MAGGLSRALNAPGGINVSEACARAQENLQITRDRSLAFIAECLADMEKLATLEAPPPEVRRELHRLSCSIAGLGGMFERDALSKAAYGFCRLLDETEPGWVADAVQVYLDGMRLLFTPGEYTAEQQATIVDGLRRVRIWAVSEAGQS